MSSGPRPRRPIKVVAMVVAYWIMGNILQTVLASQLLSAGLLNPETAGWAGLIVGWGLLCAVSFVFRERLDDWLRA